jgi:hypothetical protein
MRNPQTTHQQESPPDWLTDAVDIAILAAVLLAISLAALL